ncbi:MAG: hypothetical protein HOJ11_14030 [Gammaproteobacteria bacterium]|nr:hypothetical protein [Gammaproteobacteria bacterium]
MSDFLAQWLPHAGSALVFASAATVIVRRFIAKRAAQGIFFGSVFFLCLAPLAEFSLSHYTRILTGDLSITGFLILGLTTYQSFKAGKSEPDQSQLLAPALAIVLASIVLYPTALGLTYFDLYAFGYYPIILGPITFVLFASALWFGFTLSAVLLAMGFLAFALGILESDNLWDYLLDPVITAYAFYLVIKHRRQVTKIKVTQHHIEVMSAITISTFLLFAIYLAKFNHEAFRYEFVIEDGFVEWCTVIVLFSTMLVCGKRFLTLRRVRSPLFLSVTMLLTLLCLFGAGEEISWGQRLFELETPDYLKDRNAQGELGIHNLVVEINGEKVKLNKLIFGTGLALALLIYLSVATPLYRKNNRVRSFFNAIAAPMPRNYHIVGYLLIVATVELLIDSSKRGEMTEFAGSIMFALNVIYPYNREIFDPKKSL